MRHASDDQRKVIAFLSSPASYGLYDGEVEQIATHCSIVFLIADRAYKLKRAIRYASLDYTSLPARQMACEAELILNRRTAPELYLGVRTVTCDAAGTLAFDGIGQVLDHVVVMRRFAQSDRFDVMAERGALTREMMRTLGASIARFHFSALSMPNHGGSAAIHRVIADNERELGLVASALDGAAVDTLGQRTRRALASLAALLDRRRAEGRVRRCHGDLRLANICLYGGRPTLFDCIEFSDEVGCIDVLYDVAFLLMDLQLRGEGELANAVFNAYADIMPDAEGLRALPLFLALRAATRSYALAGGAGRQTDPHRAAYLMTLARRHVDAGLDFLAPVPPRLIALGGMCARERQDLAALLAGRTMPVPGARIVHLAAASDDGWREAGAVLAAGGAVLLEARFARAAERARARGLALARGVLFEGLWHGPAPSEPQDEAWRTIDMAGEPCGLSVDLNQCAVGRVVQAVGDKGAGHASDGPD